MPRAKINLKILSKLSNEGKNLNETGRRLDTNEIVVKIDKRYFRPAEVNTLLGDASKAREKLGWQPTTTLEELVSEMVAEDLLEAQKEALLKREGYDINSPQE